jgi:predicted kinase
MTRTLSVKILQSDRVRKQLLDVPTDKPMALPFESGIYSK